MVNALIDAFILWQLEIVWGSGTNALTTAATQLMAGFTTTQTTGAAFPLPRGLLLCPLEKAKKVAYKSPNKPAGDVYVLNKGQEYLPADLPLGVQTQDFLAMALAQATVTPATAIAANPVDVAGVGEYLCSMMLHWYNGLSHYENYGLVIEEHKLSIKKDDFLTQTIKTRHWRSKFDSHTQTTYQPTAVAKLEFIDPTSFPPLHHGNVTLTVDSTNVTDIESCDITTKNIFESDDGVMINSPYGIRPTLKDREITVEITSLTVAQALHAKWLQNHGDANRVTITLVLPFTTSRTLTLTYMMVSETNTREWDEDKFHSNKLKFEQANGFTVALTNT